MKRKLRIIGITAIIGIMSISSVFATDTSVKPETRSPVFPGITIKDIVAEYTDYPVCDIGITQKGNAVDKNTGKVIMSKKRIKEKERHESPANFCKQKTDSQKKWTVYKKPSIDKKHRVKNVTVYKVGNKKYGYYSLAKMHSDSKNKPLSVHQKACHTAYYTVNPAKGHYRNF